MKLTKKQIAYALLGLLSGVVVGIYLFTPREAGATFNQKYYLCHVEKPDDGGVNQQTLHLPLSAYLSHLFQHKADYAGKCKDVEVTPTPTELPDYCPEEGYQPYGPCLPEEEVTPTPTKGSESNVRFEGSTTNPPAARVCTIYHAPATVWYEKGQFKWATDEQGIQKFSIVYGPTPNEQIYGIDNIPQDSRGIEINRPKWNQTWFSVWTWIDNCSYESETIDP